MEITLALFALLKFDPRTSLMTLNAAFVVVTPLAAKIHCMLLYLCLFVACSRCFRKNAFDILAADILFCDDDVRHSVIVIM